MNRFQKSAYRQPQWKVFSRKVIEENQCRCSRCNRHESEGITLQVHHKYYKPELFHAPWDYPLNAFEVLCSGCHAREHGHIMPMDGWEYIGCEDMEEPCVDCEYPNCTYEGQLRYVHTVYHPKWGYLNVGCGHADKLTGTKQASDIEKDAKNRQTRFDSFLKKWQQTGDRWYREFIDFPITITQHQNSFQLSIFFPLPETYNTLFEAQKTAFEICDKQTPKQFFEQHNIPYPDTTPRKPHSKKNPVIFRNQLTYAIGNQTGKLVHIDSVQPDVLCNCICPACSKPLKAENTSEQQNNHRFIHLNNDPCEDYFPQMYILLAIQLIEQNKTLILPAYNNDNAELHIPEITVDIKTIQQTMFPYNAIGTYSLNNINLQVGIIIDIVGTTSDEQIQAVKSSSIPAIQISLIKPYHTNPPLKLKELQELLLTNSAIFTWLHSPHYDARAEQLLQNRQQYLDRLQLRIQQEIDNCIIDGYEIEQIADTYSNHDKYPTSVKQLFNDAIQAAVNRIICNPSENDLLHTQQCIEIIRWYKHYNTYRGINDELTNILKHCNFVELSKQRHNHTRLRFELLQNLFGYYFQNEADYLNEDSARIRRESIKTQIQQPFLKRSPIFDRKSILSREQKYGMELFFSLYLYYGVEHISWNINKKERMFREISNANNLPIFAAIGSLWFGHIFNRFQTDDVQSFIHIIATQYPQAAPWVLTFIKRTNYSDYCSRTKISYAELEPLRDEYDNIWLDGIFYSALKYYEDSNKNRYEVFPKVLLPKIYK